MTCGRCDRWLHSRLWFILCYVLLQCVTHVCCVAMCFVEKMLLHIPEQCFTVVLPKLSWVQYNSEALLQDQSMEVIFQWFKHNISMFFRLN